MGIDLRSVPVLLDSEPLQAIRSDAAVWENASWRPPFGSGSGFGEPMPEVNKAMLADRPRSFDTFKGPWHSGSRSYGQAEYALDPAAYRQLNGYEERERSLPYRIVHGDRRFADHALATQGIPWRCSTRTFLLEAADVIEARDEAAIRREFSVKEMAERGVYKTRPDDDEDEVFAHAMDNLQRLAHYYRDIADHDYDLIVIMD
ncbi:DUF1877 family protein [Actinomadura roseirufa]|uniref:DUF1877 family protein n=1 Tax=Actinomadura roseirufa TaxID=2094049 RepID=UPI0013F1555D|nr:DUF1877 family protein [Actinomadura roseirufa]